MEKQKDLAAYEVPETEKFMKLRTFALLGASSKKRKFGNIILSSLLKRGYTVYPVHKTARVIEGIRCYNSFAGLPEKPEGVILVIPPYESRHVVDDIVRAGIKNVWFQQGSESAEALNNCVLSGLNVVSGECILMYTEKPGFPHNLHKWISNFWSL